MNNPIIPDNIKEALDNLDIDILENELIRLYRLEQEYKDYFYEG